MTTISQRGVSGIQKTKNTSIYLALSFGFGLCNFGLYEYDVKTTPRTMTKNMRKDRNMMINVNNKMSQVIQNYIKLQSKLKKYESFFKYVFRDRKDCGLVRLWKELYIWRPKKIVYYNELFIRF